MITRPTALVTATDEPVERYYDERESEDGEALILELWVRWRRGGQASATLQWVKPLQGVPARWYSLQPHHVWLTPTWELLPALLLYVRAFLELLPGDPQPDDAYVALRQLDVQQKQVPLFVWPQEVE